MRSVISHITSFVLLVHMGVGCCWHHAHAEASDRETGTSASERVGHWHAPMRRCEHPRPETSHSGNGDSQGDHSDEHDCAGDHCVFVRPDSSPAQHVAVDGDFMPLVATAPFDQVAAPACDLRAAIRAEGLAMEFAPPVRAHLLFSILLI